MLAEDGFTVIETSWAGATVSAVEPVTVPEVALMFALPVPAPVARPPAFIAATVGVSEAQVAEPVTFCELPSVKVPVAVNCCVAPRAIEGSAGLTAIETSAAGLTVMVVLPLTEPEVALMEAEPVAKLVARPSEPALLLMVATEASDELQFTVAVRFCVLPSVNVPVAVNCWLAPRGVSGSAGVTAMDTSVAGVTVKAVDPDTLSRVAVTVVLPTPALLAIPEVLTVAIAALPVLQATEFVMLSVLPSL